MSTIYKQIHGSMTKRMQSIFSVCTLFNLRKQATLRDATTGFPREMTSEKRAQKFHTDDASLHRSGQCF